MSVQAEYQGFKINFDSPADAAAFFLGLDILNGLATAATRTRTPRVAPTRKAKAPIILRAMADMTGDEIPASMISQLLELKGENALGPASKQLKREFSEKGIEWERVRDIRRTATNGAFWRRGPDFYAALEAFGLPQPNTSVNEPSPGAQATPVRITEFLPDESEERGA